jgi:2-ketoarginine methyltransferase
MSTNGFEIRLIDALQPIRGFALAQGIYHLFTSGLFDQLRAGTTPLPRLVETVGTDPERTVGFLRYLANEGLVVLDGDAAALTARGRELAEFRPWYELLIGGYAQTFQQITSTIRGDGYATRDGAKVGIGSCGISQYDALPLVRSLLVDLPAPPFQIIDLGCGDGAFLVELARQYPGARAIGVDVEAPSDRDGIKFHRMSAVSYVRSLASEPATADPPRRLFVAGFLLQEILEQEGRATVVQLVRDVLRPHTWMAIVEVDHRPTDPAVMRHGLGLAYYNPYYLLHVLTEQRLETMRFWLELFDEAGAKLVARRLVDPEVDSTGLEFGCLLTSK